jgi:uncharacterized protein DUF5677
MPPQESPPAEYRARMIEKHRPAFDLWRRCHELLESVVPVARDQSLPFARAADIMFIQAFKSHGSLYVLSVRGHGEDAATILRRMLEIALQMRFLCEIPAQRLDRAQRYLAWFWLQAEKRIKVGLRPEQQVWWQTQYDAHKGLILKSSGRPKRNWWGDSNIRDLANTLGLVDTYDQDYRFLSQMAHCTSQGILLGKIGNVIQIRTDMLVREILVFGTRYYDRYRASME